MECHARRDEVRDWEDQPRDARRAVKELEDLVEKMEFNGEVEYASREADPQTWAEHRIQAADKYLNLVDAAERKANMEKVIAHYLAAAEVLTKDKFPERWANIQMSLCAAYLQRVVGVRRENMENAMKCFNASKEVLGDDPLPADWLKQQWEKGAEARRRDAAMTV
jgi:tetratricopeptide (TPR) repeat protein